MSAGLAGTPKAEDLFALLTEHERKFNSSFALVPSENLLSPLARAAFLSDAFSRYFFDEHEAFGRWSFQGGSIVGRIQQEIVVPIMREIGGAQHVNLHAISGLSGMTLALAAFGGPAGSRVVSVPVSSGGHPDTAYVAGKLGYEVSELPFSDYAHVDLDALSLLVREQHPALVYLDHASTLVPMPLADVIAVIRASATEPVHIHVDTSHVNGLIWGGQLVNPLSVGADTYGGSTHKTFPGPHKAIILTDNADLAEQLLLTAVNMISHHHVASVVALGISLLEFVHCGGDQYAKQVLLNAKAFAAALAERGIDVQGDEAAGFTSTHHVWAAAPGDSDAYKASGALFTAGLVVNAYNPLPSLGGPGIRMGVSEATKLGLMEADMAELADAYAAVVIDHQDPGAVATRVADLRTHFEPAYCYRGADMLDLLGPFLDQLTDERRAYAGGARSERK